MSETCRRRGLATPLKLVLASQHWLRGCVVQVDGACAARNRGTISRCAAVASKVYIRARTDTVLTPPSDCCRAWGQRTTLELSPVIGAHRYFARAIHPRG